MAQRHILHVAIAAVFAWLGIIATPAFADDPVKVAFVYVGPVGDHGWTYRHDIGRQAVEAEFGDQVETTYVESVSEGADAERVIRELAASGNDIIFTTSFGYMNPTVKVATQFPDVRFEHATGYKRDDNVSTYAARFYEGRYVIGRIAAQMTQSNIIGYIGSFPIPEVVRGINSFTLAMRALNPDAVVKVVWVSSWYDPGKEAEAAAALIDQGADIIVQHTDSTAPLQAAQSAGAHGFGQASDMAAFAPAAQLTSIVDNWDGYYIDRVRQVIEGTWESEDTWGGINTGMVELAPYNADVLSPEIIADAEATAAGISNGSIVPFAGPIRNQAGEEQVAEGESLGDGDLLGMNWYVEGVEGNLPD
jgi:simple sugar transport system substrate-binding protein